MIDMAHYCIGKAEGHPVETHEHEENLYKVKDLFSNSLCSFVGYLFI
jgi:hypothetical protein